MPTEGESLTDDERAGDSGRNAERPNLDATSRDAANDRAEEHLYRQQKIEAVGQLAAGLAHDFNNILETIITSVRFLRTLEPTTHLSSPEVGQCLDDIQGVAHRAADLTRRLLDFTRREPGEDQRCDLALVVDGVARLVRRTFPASIDLHTTGVPELFVRGHPAQIEQMLMNLCLNARDAMQAGGTLRIDVRRGGDAQIAEQIGLAPGRYVTLVVEDTGSGMDDATRARIFEPFFTTKAKGRGSGLGLATAYSIVAGNGGRITVRTAVGKGTAFTVYLPETDRPKPGTQRRRPGSSLRNARFSAAERAAGIVLLVDDDDAVRRALSRLLTRLGYQVVVAEHGAQAIAIFEERQHEVRAVLLDVDMPKPDGVETFLRLRQIDPEATVMLMSGYHDEATRERLRALGAFDFFPKPVDLNALDRSLMTQEPPADH